MTRITSTNLDKELDIFAFYMGVSRFPYKQDESGKYIAQIGAYTYSHDASGWGLERIMTDGGGVDRIVSGMTTTEMYYFMRGANYASATLKRRQEQAA